MSDLDQEEILKLLQRAPQVGASHAFWDTQPVPKLGSVGGEGPIDVDCVVSKVRATAYPLPASFEWVSCDVKNESVLTEIYELLNANYVEDDDCLFRFDYSASFLLWALTPPGYRADWHIGVRTSAGKLVAFISGIPATMSVNFTHSCEMAEINFLCIHKKLRSKRLAPVLIKEVTRRVNLENIWQAAYTAGVFLPTPVATCRYYHRSLNPKKLVEIGFSRLAPRMTLGRTIKLYKTNEVPLVPGFRAMERQDIPQVTTLLKKKLDTFKLHPNLTCEEVEHWLLPRDGVVYAYVVEQGGIVSDLASFYSLPSSVLGNEKHKTLNAAYQFWTVANSVSLEALTRDVLSMAHTRGFDVFNALDLMDNIEIFEPLKFGIGDGQLQYYLYNFKCPQIMPKEVGLILL